MRVYNLTVVHIGKGESNVAIVNRQQYALNSLLKLQMDLGREGVEFGRDCGLWTVDWGLGLGPEQTKMLSTQWQMSWAIFNLSIPICDCRSKSESFLPLRAFACRDSCKLSRLCLQQAEAETGRAVAVQEEEADRVPEREREGSSNQQSDWLHMYIE